MGAFFARKFVQSQNVTRIKAFVRKMRVKNVDEIGSSPDSGSFSFHGRDPVRSKRKAKR